MSDHKKYQDEQLKALGLDPTKITDAQRDIVLQPMAAPENYHQDGEVSNAEAKNIWTTKMHYAGFTSMQTHKIIKHYGL